MAVSRSSAETILTPTLGTQSLLPPLFAQNVYEYIYEKSWRNELNKPPFDYDMRSRLLAESDSDVGYLESSEEELVQLKRFILKRCDTRFS